MCENCDDQWAETYSNGLCQECNSLICCIIDNFGEDNLLPYLKLVNKYVNLYEEMIRFDNTKTNVQGLSRDPLLLNPNQASYQVFPIAVNGRKICSKGGKEWPATPEYFHRDSRRRDGLTSWCKKCKKEYDKWNKLYKNYGITRDLWQGMLRRQNYRCDLCGDPFTDKLKPHLDHNHSSGKIRGLVCVHCNNVLGFGKEKPKIYRQTIDYIERYSI